MGDEMSKRKKFLFITWIGPSVGVMKRAKMSTDKAKMKEILAVRTKYWPDARVVFATDKIVYHYGFPYQALKQKNVLMCPIIKEACWCLFKRFT